MNHPTSPFATGVPPALLNRCGHSLAGVLYGFDRLRLRGTLRYLFQPTVMEAYLNACRVLIKDFGSFANALTARVKAAVYATAGQRGRPFRYLSHSQISKEDLARQIAREEGVTTVLSAIFSAWETCLAEGNVGPAFDGLVLGPDDGRVVDVLSQLSFLRSLRVLVSISWLAVWVRSWSLPARCGSDSSIVEFFS